MTELRKLVEGWGWSGAELARKSGICHPGACRALRGERVGLVSRRRIADALNAEVGVPRFDANDVLDMIEEGDDE